MNKHWTVMILLSIIIIGFVVSIGMVYFLNLEYNGKLVSDGNVVSQERALEGFDAIVLDGVGDVKVHPGENYKVVVTSSNNIQEKVITKVDEKTLYIDLKGNFSVDEAVKISDLTIDVYLPELKNVSLEGAGNIEITGGNSSELGISMNGIGNINAENYKVENVNVILSGTGDVTLWATKTLTGELSGTGNINALKNSVETADVVLSGVGDISVWVSQTLKGELSGIGNIFYKGNPTTKDVNMCGVGRVTHSN